MSSIIRLQTEEPEEEETMGPGPYVNSYQDQQGDSQES